MKLDEQRKLDEADLAFRPRGPKWDVVKNRHGHKVDGLSTAEKNALIAQSRALLGREPRIAIVRS